MSSSRATISFRESFKKRRTRMSNCSSDSSNRPHFYIPLKYSNFQLSLISRSSSIDLSLNERGSSAGIWTKKSRLLWSRFNTSSSLALTRRSINLNLKQGSKRRRLRPKSRKRRGLILSRRLKTWRRHRMSYFLKSVIVKSLWMYALLSSKRTVCLRLPLYQMRRFDNYF